MLPPALAQPADLRSQTLVAHPWRTEQNWWSPSSVQKALLSHTTPLHVYGMAVQGFAYRHVPAWICTSRPDCKPIIPPRAARAFNTRWLCHHSLLCRPWADPGRITVLQGCCALPICCFDGYSEKWMPTSDRAPVARLESSARQQLTEPVVRSRAFVCFIDARRHHA